MIKLIEQVTYIQPSSVEISLRRLLDTEEHDYIIERMLNGQLGERVWHLNKTSTLRRISEWEGFEKKIGSEKN